MADPVQCVAARADGSPCRARPLPGKDRCAFHDPDMKARRDAGRVAGGRARAKKAAVLPEGAPDAKLGTIAEVAELLGLTINQLRKGQLDAKLANAVGYLAGVLVTAIKQGDLERRIEEIERRLAEGADHADPGAEAFAGGSPPDPAGPAPGPGSDPPGPPGGVPPGGLDPGPVAGAIVAIPFPGSHPP
jgi:hypothetical protein